MNSWDDRRVMMNGITFQVSKEVISMVTGLAMKGRKWKKVMRFLDEANLNYFFWEEEEPIHHYSGFRREKLLDTLNEVCLVLMKYLTLEGRCGVCYYYYFPLNHFRHGDSFFIPFFLLHELVDTIMDVREKMKKGADYTILH